MDTKWDQGTIFYPLTANPLGFHHLVAAEWLLQRSSLQKVVLLISNGLHPDPSKSPTTIAASHRLRWAKQLLRESDDENKSTLAEAAKNEGGLAIKRAAEICERELQFDRPVRLAEHIIWLKSLGIKNPINVLAGTDLLARLGDPSIFSDADTLILTKDVLWHLLERESSPQPPPRTQQRVADLHCQLKVIDYPLKNVPRGLLPFLPSSSRAIRRCAEARDPLTAMVSSGLVQEFFEAYAPDPNSLSLLQQDHNSAWQKLLRTAQLLHEKLLASNPTPALSISETSSGGLISHSLLACSNASCYFHQARIPYSRAAQLKLSSAPESSVSEKHVRTIAQQILRKSQTEHPGLVIVESGMAGPPDGKRQSPKNGQTWLALASQRHSATHLITLPPFQTRLEHQLAFATQALRWVHKEFFSQFFSS